MNYKTYIETTGKAGLRLAEAAKAVSDETGASIAVAPQCVDLKTIVERVGLPVFAQHVDPVDAGAFTGHITADAVKTAGASGTLINHSERRLKLAEIDSIVQKARALDLLSVVCADTAKVSAATAGLNPDMVAIEPPELIGSGIAVSKARPEIVSETVSVIKKLNPRVTVLCGAGITTGEDVAAAIRLGAQGVLVASGVVKAKDQKAALLDLAEGAFKA